MAFDRMRALETYLQSCSGLANFNEILEQQCVQLAKEIQNLTKLDFDEGAPLLAMVQQNQLWSKPHKETISQAIHRKVQESMGGKGVVRDRVQHQQFTWFPQYLTKSDWEIVMTTTIPAAQKCSVVMDRLWKLDLRSPNEDTYAMITVVLLLTETQRFMDAVQLRSSYLSVKGLVKSFLKGRIGNLQPTWTHKDLPPVVAALEQERVATAYAEGDGPASLPEGITMEYLQHWMNVVPQRSNSSSISISLPKSVPWQVPGMHGGMLMGNMGMMPMALPMHHGMMMSPGMHQPSLPALPAPANLCQPASSQLGLQYPGQLALPAPPSATSAVSPSAVTAPTVTAPAVTAAAVTAPVVATEIEVVPARATPVKKPLALTDGSVQDDVNKKEHGQGTSAVDVSMQLEKALSARDAEKKDSKAKQDDEKNDKQKDQKDDETVEEQKPCLKRPATKATRKSQMKRPASSSSVVPRVPEVPKQKATKKKEKKDSSKTMECKKKQAKSGGHCKGPITKKQRLKLRPEGCSGCRFVAGCCDSCWIKRNYRPV